MSDGIRVLAAAVQIKTPNGDLTLSSPPPDRHHNLIGVLNWLGVKPNDIDQAEQGFLLSDGTFANRQQALGVARHAGQIIRRCGGDEHALYSENLW